MLHTSELDFADNDEVVGRISLYKVVRKFSEENKVSSAQLVKLNLITTEVFCL